MSLTLEVSKLEKSISIILEHPLNILEQLSIGLFHINFTILLLLSLLKLCW